MIPILSRTWVLVLLFLSLPLSALAAPQKGQPAPSLKVLTTTGQSISLASYKGNVVVLDFFASWCVPCGTSIPHLLNLKRRYGKQGLQVIGMSLDEDSTDLKTFISDKKITYPVALINEELQTAYGLRSVPTMYVINKKGMIAEKYQGFNDNISSSMEHLIQKLLAE